MNNCVWKVGVIYHSPSSSDSIFIEAVERICKDNITNNNKFILFGDFNINYLNSDNFYTNKIKNTFTMLGLEQIINTPTRVTNNSSTLIDYIVTNQSGLNTGILNTIEITDHTALYANLFCRNKKNLNRHTGTPYRLLNDKNIHEINMELIAADWSLLDYTDINKILDEFTVGVTNIVDRISPLIVSENSKQNLPWFGNELQNKMYEKDQAYKQFKKSNTVRNGNNMFWVRYKKCRNDYGNLLKFKKKKYYEEKIDINRGNPKLMWKTLKQLIKGEDHSFNIKTISFDINNSKVVASELTELANHFNNYFISSIREIVSTVENIENSNIYIQCNSNLNGFQPITIQDVSKIIKELKNSSETNSVLSTKFLKGTINSVGHILLHIINTSLVSGQFPNQLKLSTVIPIPKVANTNLASDHRPINTLPPIEKVIEVAAYNQLVNYFNDNNILVQYQSGFRANHSCESSLQLTVANWAKDIDNGKYIVAVFIDLKRAFETIDRSILLNKLMKYGITGNALMWLKDYLSERTQRCKINNIFSDNLKTQYGVPQGSVLGPLLFNIYINDINASVNCSFLNLFADDTLVVISDENLESALQKMNIELCKIQKYFNVNKLILNANKTKAMIITTPYKHTNININNVNLQLNNSSIEIVLEFKYLGFILDNTLSFKKHSQYIQKKIRKKLFFFYRISANLSMASRLLVYNTIIQPHFNYCSSLLFLLDKNSQSVLQKLQNRGMRIILRCNRYTPISLMLEILNWQSIHHRLYYFTMIFLYKILQGLLPSYLRSFVTFNHEIHEYNTRSRNNLHIERTNSKKAMNSIFFKGIKQYNSLPKNIKDAATLKKFKTSLISHIKTL